MVFEGLISPINAEKKPWEMFFLGILYSSLAILIALFLFAQYASLIMVFFTVATTIPLFYWTIKLEEKKDLAIHDERLLIKEHGKALAFLMFLFLGFVFSFTLWYIFLPEPISVKLFEVQTNTITDINDPIAGNAFNFAGTLLSILINNLKVLMFCLIFAFFYGFGAIFILTWNASIIGAAIGEFVKSHVGHVAAILPLALLRYMVHGIPEMVAYFMAGLAGGIISIAVIRHDFGSGKFKHIIIDSLDLTIGSVAVLVIAALLEVFVSPLIG
jgi:uncharacterized membrane protein SpoIIM required for sporulation